jgi:anaerobic sulfite reductase subunit A
MGFKMTKEQGNTLFEKLSAKYDVFAPKLFVGDGCFSDIDVIRYDKVNGLDEIVFDKKSDYSFKESLLAIHQVLFYFTEDETTIPKEPQKPVLIFLKSCDLHALKRLDEMYLKNGAEDFYYARIRNSAKFVLMGCETTCETGFCVSMGTNQSTNYDMYLKVTDDGVKVDCLCEELKELVNSVENEQVEITVDYVTENKEKVTLPKNLSIENYDDEIWTEYGSRCIACGRCNFVCPTCTCFTMQDIYYKENAKVGERRRVWASCQVDGYTDMAGGHSFRNAKSDRFRFKVMHKISDFGKRFGYNMCVGCGRCDAVCPEYISFANCINRLAQKEGK